MCGIAGVLRLGERPLPPIETLRRMLGSIRHRGPDEQGEFRDGDILLGAARLSVTDPEGGRQPVSGCSPAVVAVFNGEIYDHAGIARRLRQAGHAIPDRCDTSVLPHLYEEVGDDLPRHLRGMFAIAVWDARARRLLLARDRLGIKPLVYVETPDFLVFASEAKAVLASALVPAEIDRDSLDDLFSLAYPCPPRTMFRGVLELRPGHVLSVSPGRPATGPRRYWRAAFPRRGEHRSGRRRDLEAEFRDRLASTVCDHLPSDGPAGAYLSGGLDSSTIAALYRDASGAPPELLSIGFDDPRFDETACARLMAGALGTELHTIAAGPRTAELLPDMLRALELPLLVPGALAGLLLSAEARSRGLKVVFTGDGADELLGGYDCFRADRLRRAFDRPLVRGLRPHLYRRLYRWFGMPDGAVEFLTAIEARPAREVEAAFGGLYPPWYTTWHFPIEREALLGAGARTVRPAGTAPPGLAPLVREDAAEMDPLDAALAFELESRLPSWILVISDRSSMAHGVEVRVPFLDHELVDFVASLPPPMKLGLGREKALVRRAMRGRLPEAIRRRTKRPFVVPVREWFFGPGAPEFVEESLSDRAVREAALFAPEVVRSLRARLASAPGGHIDRVRLELTLMLVLSAQLLHRLFVAR